MTPHRTKTLFEAIEKGAVSAVTTILDEDPAALEAIGQHKNLCRDKTPLMYAVQCNHVFLTKLLIGRGANVNARVPGDAGLCALQLAVQSVLPGKFGEPAIKNVRRLLDAGADPNDALWGACLAARKPAEQAGILELFLARGANPDLRVGDSGNTVRELVRINARNFPPRVLELLGIAP